MDHNDQLFTVTLHVAQARVDVSPVIVNVDLSFFPVIPTAEKKKMNLLRTSTIISRRTSWVHFSVCRTVAASP